MNLLPRDHDAIAADQMAGKVLSPGVEVPPIVLHPAGRPGGGEQNDRRNEPQWAPDGLAPAPGSEHDEPGDVTEPRRRESVQQPVLEIDPGRNSCPHAAQSRGRAASHQLRLLRGEG